MGFQLAFVVIVTLGLPLVSAAQEKPAPTPLVIDLARGWEQTLRVDAGTYQIHLTNAVPGREYYLRVGPSQAIEAPVLKMPAAKEAIALGKQGGDTCALLTAAAFALAIVESEAEVGQRVDAVRLALASAGECKTEREQAATVVESTKPKLAPVVVINAEAVRQITILNSLGGSWQVGLNSAGRGVWQTTYGFAFNPNHDEEFFSEATGDKEFTIRRKDRDKNSVTFLPSVFFNWLSSSQAFGNIQHGPTLGVGLTSGGGRLGGLLGYSVRFNQNIGLTAGISAYPHRRLDGKYREGQVLKEALDSDKLNKDSVRGNFFVAFTLRLGASPFGK